LIREVPHGFRNEYGYIGRTYCGVFQESAARGFGAEMPEERFRSARHVPTRTFDVWLMV
jgi:hypothetical protein